VLIAQARVVSALEPSSDQWHPVRTSAAGPVMTLPLSECLQLALQRQPRIAVQRASLAAAEDGQRALETLRVPTILDPELPVRRRQACLGVTAATAGLDQVERETTYAVTRTYITVLYARDQERVARAIVERLSATRDAAKRQLDAGAREVTSVDVNRATVYLRLAQTKSIQAAQGSRRALAALKEAIGLEQDVQLDVPAGRLPEPQVQPSREGVIASALARRGELIRASIFAQATCLEVEAQASRHLKRMPTFAAGADIHAVQVAEGIHNGDYRPAGVPPEMPTMLAGERAERVKRAESLQARAGAALEATRSQIALEAEDAFLRWEEAARQVPPAREAADAGDQLAEEVNKDFTAGSKIKVEEVVSARVLASQARSQYNEFLYREILALVDLERITAGGFSAGLPNSR